MKRKFQRLRPEWVKTDIPEDIKLKYHWKAMIGATTCTAWQQNMAKITGTTEDQPYRSRVSRDTYNQLREELLGMPEILVMKLPEDLKLWVCGVRGITLETMSVIIDDATKAHDVGIFKNLDSIMSERDLLSFYGDMRGQHICYSSQLSKIQGFLLQYAMEGNKYVIEELQGLTDELCDHLSELLHLVETTFSRYPDNGDGTDVKYGIRLDLKKPHNGIDGVNVTEEDLEPEEELMALTDWLYLHIYKKYREGIKRVLIV